MKRILFVILGVLSLTVAGFSQEIADQDRRGFDDLTPLKIDVDGDAVADTITPRVYRISTKKGTPAKGRGVQNWIAFDLATSRGKIIKSFFKYNYGTAEQGGSYWVYALKAAGDLDGDGTTDLIFYSGDDTTDETVWLANKENRFVELRRKTSDSDDW